jgi:hypothetical protein
VERGICGRVEHIRDEDSAENMNISFQRMVALTATGLMTGAVLRLIYQALRETKS